MSQKIYLKFFLAIIIVGCWLRLTQLGQIPVSLYWDEVAILIDAKSVAETGLDMHGRPGFQLIFPSYGDYKLPVYIWFSSIMVKIFGDTNWSIRLVSAMAGIGTIVLAGWIAKLLFKNTEAAKASTIQLSTMAVIAFSPWSILFSRTGFEGHLAQFLLAGSVALLLVGQQQLSAILHDKRSAWNFMALTFGSIILGALATYTYFSVRFVWPIVSTAVWLLHWSKYLKLSQKPKWWFGQAGLTLTLPLIIFMATLIPMTKSPLYEISNQFRLSTTSIFNGFDYAIRSNQLRAQAGNLLIDRLFFHRHLLLIKELAINYADHLNLNYLFVTGDSNLRHGTGWHGLFLFASLPIFLYGLIKLWLSHQRVWLTLIIWWLAALLPAAVPETTPHALRSLNALVPISIVIGFGLSELIILARRRTYHQGWKILAATLLLFNLLNFGHFANHYFNHYPSQSAYSWQDGYQELATVMAKEQPHVNTVWVDGIDGRFYLWLLAYGNLTSTEIQALPKTNFMLEKIDNVNFAPFDWDKLQTNHFKILVVGEAAIMKQRLATISIRPNWTTEIIDHAGVTRFVVAHFGE